MDYRMPHIFRFLYFPRVQLVLGWDGIRNVYIFWNEDMAKIFSYSYFAKVMLRMVIFAWVPECQRHEGRCQTGTKGQNLEVGARRAKTWTFSLYLYLSAQACQIWRLAPKLSKELIQYFPALLTNNERVVSYILSQRKKIILEGPDIFTGGSRYIHLEHFATSNLCLCLLLLTGQENVTNVGARCRKKPGWYFESTFNS